MTIGQKLKVKFAPKATMRFALHIDNYTTEEREATFYDNEDFKRFKKDIRATATKLKQADGCSMRVDTDDFCALGIKLSAASPHGPLMQTSEAKKSRFAVFVEQTRLRHQGKQFDDDADEKIAAAYTEAIEKNVVMSALNRKDIIEVSAAPSSPTSVISILKQTIDPQTSKKNKRDDESPWQLYTKSPTYLRTAKTSLRFPRFNRGGAVGNQQS